jgi:perosamine synthetase
MLRIPFYKPSIGGEEIEEVAATLRSGWLTTGPKTKQFEREFGDYVKQKHAIAVNSCTAAMHLALEAIGIKPGQGVIVPTMTFAATAEVVRYFGARPILVDCRVEDFNLDVGDAERKIQSALATGQSVAAIMPVHYGGQIGDVAGVRALAKRHNLKVVEDAAHCCPAFYRNPGTLAQQDCASRGMASEGQSPAATGHGDDWLSVGTGGDISCYSFYANKTITTGEGGMACTENEDYMDRMRIMSLHGISRDAWKRYTAEGSWYYEIIAPGFKYNMTDIAAAMGIHQLRKADRFHRRRTEVAALYHEQLKNVEEICLPQVQPNRIHSWHLFAIRLQLERLSIDRAQFITELQQRGVGTSVHWQPLHMHPYYRETYGYAPQDFPVACALYPQIITLPIYPDLTEDEVKYVCRSIEEIVAGSRKSGGK